VFNLKSRALSGSLDGHQGAITAIEAIGTIVISGAKLKPTIEAPTRLEIKLWNILDGRSSLERVWIETNLRVVFSK